MIVFIEVITFCAGLGVFVIQRKSEPAIFHAGRALLNQPLALANTIALLTGGWLMAAALEADPSRALVRLALAVTAAKCLLVGRRYMDLRHAHPAWTVGLIVLLATFLGFVAVLTGAV